MIARFIFGGLKNVSNFRLHFRPFWGAIWDPKRAQNRAQEAPQTLSGPGYRRKLFWSSILGSFWTPRDLENRAPMQAGARFSENQLLELGVEKGPQNDPQNDPKRAPRGSQIAQADVQNGCSILGEISSQFSVIFRLPRAPPKMTPKGSKRGLGSGRPPGSHFGAIWG